MRPQFTLACVLFWVGRMLDVKLLHKRSQITYNLLVLSIEQVYCYRINKLTISYKD